MVIYLQRNPLHEMNNELIHYFNKSEKQWYDHIIVRGGFLSAAGHGVILSIAATALNILCITRIIKPLAYPLYWVWYSGYRKIKNLTRQVSDLQYGAYMCSAISLVGTLNPRWADCTTKKIHVYAFKRADQIVQKTQDLFAKKIKKGEGELYSLNSEGIETITVNEYNQYGKHLQKILADRVKNFSTDLIKSHVQDRYQKLVFIKRQCDALFDNSMEDLKKLSLRKPLHLSKPTHLTKIFCSARNFFSIHGG